MIVTAKYFGTPLSTYNMRSEHIQLADGSTIGHLLGEISKKLSAEDKELLSETTFMVNKARADKQTVLKDGDEVIIMHFLGGG